MTYNEKFEEFLINGLNSWEVDDVVMATPRYYGCVRYDIHFTNGLIINIGFIDGKINRVSIESISLRNLSSKLKDLLENALEEGRRKEKEREEIKKNKLLDELIAKYSSGNDANNNI